MIDTVVPATFYRPVGEEREGFREFQRAFGSACNAVGASLAELSPRMDLLFLSALRELAAPRATTDFQGCAHRARRSS